MPHQGNNIAAAFVPRVIAGIVETGRKQQEAPDNNDAQELIKQLAAMDPNTSPQKLTDTLTALQQKLPDGDLKTQVGDFVQYLQRDGNASASALLKHFPAHTGANQSPARLELVAARSLVQENAGLKEDTRPSHVLQDDSPIVSSLPGLQETSAWHRLLQALKAFFHMIPESMGEVFHQRTTNESLAQLQQEAHKFAADANNSVMLAQLFVEVDDATIGMAISTLIRENIDNKSFLNTLNDADKAREIGRLKDAIFQGLTDGLLAENAHAGMSAALQTYRQKASDGACAAHQQAIKEANFEVLNELKKVIENDHRLLDEPRQQLLQNVSHAAAALFTEQIEETAEGIDAPFAEAKDFNDERFATWATVVENKIKNKQTDLNTKRTSLTELQQQVVDSNLLAQDDKTSLEDLISVFATAITARQDALATLKTDAKNSFANAIVATQGGLSKPASVSDDYPKADDKPQERIKCLDEELATWKAHLELVQGNTDTVNTIHADFPTEGADRHVVGTLFTRFSELLGEHRQFVEAHISALEKDIQETSGHIQDEEKGGSIAIVPKKGAPNVSTLQLGNTTVDVASVVKNADNSLTVTCYRVQGAQGSNKKTFTLYRNAPPTGMVTQRVKGYVYAAGIERDIFFKKTRNTSLFDTLEQEAVRRKNLARDAGARDAGIPAAAGFHSDEIASPKPSVENKPFTVTVGKEQIKVTSIEVKNVDGVERVTVSCDAKKGSRTKTFTMQENPPELSGDVPHRISNYLHAALNKKKIKTSAYENLYNTFKNLVSGPVDAPENASQPLEEPFSRAAENKSDSARREAEAASAPLAAQEAAGVEAAHVEAPSFDRQKLALRDGAIFYGENAIVTSDTTLSRFSQAHHNRGVTIQDALQVCVNMAEKDILFRLAEYGLDDINEEDLAVIRNSAAYSAYRNVMADNVQVKKPGDVKERSLHDHMVQAAADRCNKYTLLYRDLPKAQLVGKHREWENLAVRLNALGIAPQEPILDEASYQKFSKDFFLDAINNSFLKDIFVHLNNPDDELKAMLCHEALGKIQHNFFEGNDEMNLADWCVSPPPIEVDGISYQQEYFPDGSKLGINTEENVDDPGNFVVAYCIPNGDGYITGKGTFDEIWSDSAKHKRFREALATALGEESSVVDKMAEKAKKAGNTLSRLFRGAFRAATIDASVSQPPLSDAQNQLQEVYESQQEELAQRAKVESERAEQERQRAEQERAELAQKKQEEEHRKAQEQKKASELQRMGLRVEKEEMLREPGFRTVHLGDKTIALRRFPSDKPSDKPGELTFQYVADGRFGKSRKTFTVSKQDLQNAQKQSGVKLKENLPRRIASFVVADGDNEKSQRAAYLFEQLQSLPETFQEIHLGGQKPIHIRKIAADKWEYIRDKASNGTKTFTRKDLEHCLEGNVPRRIFLYTHGGQQFGKFDQEKQTELQQQLDNL